MKSPYAIGTLLDTAWSSGYRCGKASKQRDPRSIAEARWFRSWLSLQDPMVPQQRLREARDAGYAAGNPPPPVEHFK